MESMSDPRPPLSTTTSLWPAAVVLITGVVMLLSFTILNTLGDKGVKKVTTTTAVIVVGGLTRDFSNHSAATCAQNQNPPSNISSALLLPLDTHKIAGPTFANQGAGDYDCSLRFSSTHSPGELLSFYKNNLSLLGWNLFSQGSSTGKPQSLFQKAGSDGFYWILGVTVNSSTTSSSKWTLRVYQNSGQI
jgi:hypothetical protein